MEARGDIEVSSFPPFLTTPSTLNLADISTQTRFVSIPLSLRPLSGRIEKSYASQHGRNSPGELGPSFPPPPPFPPSPFSLLDRPYSCSSCSVFLSQITTELPLHSPSTSTVSRRLPWEIISAIVHETEDPSTLLAFSLVSFDVLNIAGLLLWNDITVDSCFKIACIFYEVSITTLSGERQSDELTYSAPLLLLGRRYRLRCQPSPPLPTSSRLHPSLGLHLLRKLRFSLPNTPHRLEEEDPRLNLDPSGIRFPAALDSPLSGLPLEHLSLRWKDGQSIDLELSLFYLLNPRTFTQTCPPSAQDTVFQIVESDVKVYRAIVEWTRLERVVSEGVLHCMHMPKSRGMAGPSRLYTFEGHSKGGESPELIFDLRRRAGDGGERQSLRSVVLELEARMLSYYSEVVDVVEGGIVVWVSEREDEQALLGDVGELEEKQRRKYKITLRD